MSNQDKLSDAAIEAFIAAHAGWGRVQGAQGSPPSLARTFSFDDYAAGIAFVVKVAFAAEAKNHHPDLVVGYARVDVAWSTHDAGGITALDTELAEQTDKLARG
jgi:4a-hydroxytetrahydrobiopterin dehydratase